MTISAQAQPSKRFFVSMLIRDITLEDAILDLIDNSIDSITRSWQWKKIKAQDLIEKLARQHKKAKDLPKINISFNEEEFKISDECGGIDIKDAELEIFRFGYLSEKLHSFLSVYGIGLKRAIFKLGDNITIKSKTKNNGWKVEFNVKEWEAKEEEKWTFPLIKDSKAKIKSDEGTLIHVRNLHKDIIGRIKSETLQRSLNDKIAAAYTFFLEKNIRVILNGNVVKPILIPFGSSDKARPAYEEMSLDGVYTQVFAGLADRSKGEWKQEEGGWYIFCNGRMVTVADKTEITGWGKYYAAFVPKYRGFVGVVFFSSNKPELLPWRTTKRDLYIDSYIYQRTLNKMAVIAKPVINFLNKMYTTEEHEKEYGRDIARGIGTGDFIDVSEKGTSAFTVAKADKKEKTTVKVQFQARITDIDKVNKCLKKRWSAKRIGEHALHYFIDKECS